MPDSDEEERARLSLLESYSSKSIAHGTYIITIVIASVTFLQIISPIKHGDIGVFWATLVLAMFAVLGEVIFLQTMFWGMMTDAIKYVSPVEEKDMPPHLKDMKKNGEVKFTLLSRLNVAAIQSMQKYHGCIRYFTGRWLTRSEQLGVIFISWVGYILVFVGIFIFLVFPYN